MLKAIAEYAKHDRAEFLRVVQEAQSSQQTAEVRKQRTRLALSLIHIYELPDLQREKDLWTKYGCTIQWFWEYRIIFNLPPASALIAGKSTDRS